VWYFSHLASIRAKFLGRASSSNSASAESTICSLLDNHICLIPFTVDHLGGLAGRLAMDSLFSDDTSRFPKPPLPYLDLLQLSHPTSHAALHLAKLHPLHLASRATASWRRHAPGARFGPATHTLTPSQWALQFLSLNLSHALTAYLDGALFDLTASRPRSPSTLSPPLVTRGFTPPSFRFRSSRPVKPCLAMPAPPHLPSPAL
jgi:hypothetical protein